MATLNKKLNDITKFTSTKTDNNEQSEQWTKILELSKTQ